MPHKETDELSKLFDVLYRIDQRLSHEADLLIDNQKNNEDEQYRDNDK